VTETSGRKPKKIWVDEGSEFFNSTFTKWCINNNVQRYATFVLWHNPIIERFNRTLTTRLWRQFTFLNTRRWLAMLDKVVRSYNKSFHRSIGMTPVEASDVKNRLKVHKKLYPEQEPQLSKPKFAVGDIVRISRLKDKFEKGYHPNWSEELLKVVKINDTSPRTYQIEALDGEPVVGSFYEQEMQKSKQLQNNLYRVEKILQRKKVQGKKMVLVKWAGYNKPSWTEAENILD
jgi:hypothetical protein